MIYGQETRDDLPSKHPSLVHLTARVLLIMERSGKVGETDLSVTLSPVKHNYSIGPYANSLDMDETQSNSASHPDLSYLTLRQNVHQLAPT